ncbi:carcinoembryonic antigen-related cell adhesion molecule 5-like [Heterodontus francisci]|uniref:carcinoembryonic antigen-related cell adhesion molecule 5-like n=1 Tax=Heterodontus francisci TaxID=7792 RepID=UPI00355BE41A
MWYLSKAFSWSKLMKQGSIHSIILLQSICALILDGPDLPNISTNPDLPLYITRRTVTFSCSVDSSPPTELEWYLNGTSLQQKEQQLIIDSITLNDSGNYTCQAFNNVTKRYSALTKQIAVIEPVITVTVSSNNSKPVENIDTILLTCHALGFVQSRIWYKDNHTIQDNDRILTSPDNVTLTILRVNRKDSGIYKCNASNDFSRDSGDTVLQINYGPENVIIAPPGPIWAEQGEPLEFNCSALSVPAGAYEWYNGTRLLKTGQIYNIDSISSNHAGNYTCQVNNIITQKSSNATVQVTVQAQTNGDNNISSGGKAGIAIAVLLSLGLISGLIAWLVRRKAGRMKGPTQEQNDTNINSTVNHIYATVIENSVRPDENTPGTQKERATQPLDENSTYTFSVVTLYFC